MSCCLARYTLCIDPLMMTDPFLMGGMFGSPASGNRIVVFVRCMISFRVMLP
jgi:hypothetical protein